MIFLNSASSAAALVFYLPGKLRKGKLRKARVRNILKIFGKNTKFNEHPVPLLLMMYFVCQRIYYSSLSTFSLRRALLWGVANERRRVCYYFSSLTPSHPSLTPSNPSITPSHPSTSILYTRSMMVLLYLFYLESMYL